MDTKRASSSPPSRAVMLKLFLSCWLVFALHFATNTVREIYPALSLGDHLSLDVSEYLGLHPDIFETRGRGAFINNNVGASILGAVPYALARPAIDTIVRRVERQRASRGFPTEEYDTIYPLAREFLREARARGLDVKFALAAGVMQGFLMAPLSALATVVMFYLLCSLGVRSRSALMLALLYAFATPVFYRTAQLNHNLLECHAGFFAFALLFHATREGRAAHWTRFFAAGLIAGYAIVLDYSGFVVAGAVGLYGAFVWRCTPGRQPGAIAALALGIGSGVLLLWAIQWSCFGHPLWPAQQYMPETTYSGSGYRGMGWPDLELLWLLSAGRHYGLFTSAPLLVLALWPSAWHSRDSRILPRRELLFAALFTLAVFLFTSCNQFARMQFNTGIRHVLPAVPFVFLVAANGLQRLPPWLATLFGIATTAWSWALAMARDVEQQYGVLEPVLAVLRDGPQLPWLTTLQRMGYVTEGPWATLLLLGMFVLIAVIWKSVPDVRIREHRRS